MVSGKAGVGKTTLSHRFKNYLLQYTNLDSNVFSFATGVKRVAMDMGWDGVKDEKGRLLLQEVGRIGRAYDIDVWAKKTENFIDTQVMLNGAGVYFIDDWRFPNEGKYLENTNKYKMYKIRVEAENREVLRGTKAYSDISETSLPTATFMHRWEYDEVFWNDEDGFAYMDGFIETEAEYYIKEWDNL